MADYNSYGVSFASFKAGGTISKNRLVKKDTSGGTVTATSAIADTAIGVALQDASSGDQVPVQLFGKAKVVAGEAITEGAAIMPIASAGGKCAVAAGATAVACGVALEPTTNGDGDVIEVLLSVPNVRGPAVGS